MNRPPKLIHPNTKTIGVLFDASLKYWVELFAVIGSPSLRSSVFVRIYAQPIRIKGNFVGVVDLP